MKFLIIWFDDFVNKILDKETDHINQARIKMLVYILGAYMLFTGILIIAYLMDQQLAHLIRVIVIFLCAILFVVILRRTNSWRIISHIVIWLITLAVWSNLSLYVKGINVATLQYVWFACALGFYMHGLKWGVFYSCLNVVPLIIFTALDKNYFFLGEGAKQINLYTYLFVLCYDFGLILFLHYYFFKAFNYNFVNLTKAKNDLKELNEKLQTTLFDLETLSNARMNFLSTMSHELRTPMNGVIGISNALLMQNPREDQKENLAVLKFSAENLLSLINDILDFNKLDSDKLELESIHFDLALLVENNFASFALKAKEKKLDFNFSIDEKLLGKVIIGDPTRLTQVLINLLNNAIKFTSKGYVSLSAEVIQLSEDKINVRFTVSDTGIGIGKDKQNEIFEAFVQGSSDTSRYYGGTGLGLPIVKKILKIFDSEVKLESELNKGTKMYFDINFNYKEAELPIVYETTKPAVGVNNLRVLVAEDNLVNILVIRKTLEQWGIVPTIAENGIIALKKLSEADFDIILMDLFMPEMDGYETSLAIRNLPDKNKSEISIIAFTATINNDVAKRVTDSGMNGYLAKPFNPDHLFEHLQKVSLSKNVNDIV